MKQILNLRQLIVALLMLRPGLCTRRSKKWHHLWLEKQLLDNFKIIRSRRCIRRTLKKLCNEGLLIEHIHESVEGYGTQKQPLITYLVRDYNKIFEDIKRDRKELERHGDTLNHQRYRREKRLKNKGKAGDQGIFKAISYHG